MPSQLVQHNPLPEALHMREYIDRWAHYRRVIQGNASTTVHAYVLRVQQLTRYLADTGRATEPDEVTSGDIAAWLTWLYEERRNTSNATRASKLSAVRDFFAWLAAQGVVAESPAAGIPSPRFHAPAPRAFSSRQLNRIFAAPDVSTPRGLRDLTMMVVAYGLGLRRFEVAGLSLRDLTMKEKETVVRILGKGAKERTLLLRRRPTATLRKWLIQRAGYDTPSDAVFISLRAPYGRLSATAVNRRYSLHAAAANIKLKHHSFRKTWATDLYTQGLDVEEIRIMGGWDSLATVQRYLAVSRKALNKASIKDSRWRSLERITKEEGEEDA